MAAVLALSICPNCGAPHSVAAGVQHLICIYCNVSLVVQRGAAGAVVTLTKQEVPSEVIERIKQLLIDSKKEEAIALYAEAARVDRTEAERVVDEIFLTAYWTLTRYMPINAFGFLLYGVLVGGSGGLAAWAATQALLTPAYGLLVAAAAAVAHLQLRAFLRHLSSTLVRSFGARGRGRVLRFVNMREMEKDGFIVVVQFEVTPDDGRPTFIDQETLFIRGVALAKLAVGNTVAVRFDSACERVFPISPITVI